MGSKFAAAFTLSLLFTCSQLGAMKLRTGTYRGTLTLDSARNILLPFNFEIEGRKGRWTIVIRNGDERIRVDEVAVKGDSLNFRMPVFDTEFRTTVKGNSIEGVWINRYRAHKSRLPFRATHGETRRFLEPMKDGDPIFEGKWEVTFSPGTKDSSRAVGVFHHEEQSGHVTGTFLTETGDYRYLEGISTGSQLMLSCFDGSHAFLFTAGYEAGKLTNGMFYSGAHWKEPWIARRNPGFALRHADTITKFDPGLALRFSFPDTEGRLVSIDDDAFRNVPVIVQVMGSWCPNCMDESRYLSDVYRQYKGRLAVVALAFEKTADVARATAQVKRMKERLRLDYPVLITGITGKEQAAAALKPLEKIHAYPTTIFLDRSHRIVRVNTGFSGPATGSAYEEFREQTGRLIDRLINE